MARRLILDTGVLIASERAKKSPWGDVLEADDDVALAAVGDAELRTGVELAGASRREPREAFLGCAGAWRRSRSSRGVWPVAARRVRTTPTGTSADDSGEPRNQLLS